jgi:hypothetical protein
MGKEWAVGSGQGAVGSKSNTGVPSGVLLLTAH